MSIHDNSIQSYYDHINSGAKFKQREKVFKFVEYCGKHTDRAIAEAIGIERSDVRARISKLVKDGMLEEVGNTKCPVTGKIVRVVDIPRAEVQKELDL